MNQKKNQVVIKISENEASEIFVLICGEASDKYEVVDAGSWEDDGKYSIRDVIVKNKETGLTYSGCWTRTVSYFKDYDIFHPDELVQVKAVEKVIVDWVPVESE